MCRQIFVKIAGIKFHEQPTGVNPVIPCGKTDGWDRRDEASGHFSQVYLRKSSENRLAFMTQFMPCMSRPPSAKVTVSNLYKIKWKVFKILRKFYFAMAAIFLTLEFCGRVFHTQFPRLHYSVQLLTRLT